MNTKHSFRWLAGAVLALSQAVPGLTQSSPTNPSPSLVTTDNDEVIQLERMQVTGTAMRSQEEVANRQVTVTIADSLTQDDIGTLADENLADAMIRMPGVSTMQTLYGEQEASYVSMRGISPDLNFVSFDGIAMYSMASDGDGLRRVDLNLIPTQISRTTWVYKAFSADLEAGAIGGVTNIEPYSALNGKETGHLSFQLTQQTGEGKYVPAINSRGRVKDQPLGGGVKGLLVRRFGSKEQFGLVLSGVFREKNYDYTKRNPNSVVFYQANGSTANNDLSNWDGKHPFPTLIRPMDYTHYTQTFGGSAQLEYRISKTWQASILGFGYKQIEDQNLSQFYLEQFSGLTRLSEEEGRFKIGRVRPSYSYDRFEQETRGLIAKAVGKFENNSSLEFRAGRFTNRFYDLDQTATYAYSPAASYITFDMTNLITQISLENHDPLINPSNYRLNAAADTEVQAKVTSTEVRADYKKNYGSNTTGFGFATGVNLRKTESNRDSTVTTFTTNNSVLGDIGFVPNFISHNFGYPVLWIDYDRFASEVKPNLAINKNNSNNNSWLNDYFYEEQTVAAYTSFKYGTERTQYILGVRYDNVDFDALTPLDTTGIFDGTFSHKEGGYDHFLPSLNIQHAFSRSFRVKASASKSLGRPQFGDIAQAERLNETNLTISRGNPDLKPRQAKNLDLAFEYFFGRHGLISVGGFYKDIKDNIYTSAVEEEIDGVVYTVTTPRNSDAGTKVRGLELQLIHDSIPGLPGFLEKRVGASFNYTKMWGEMEYFSGTSLVKIDALQYQPEFLFNGTIYYKIPRKGEFRVSYNWNGRSPVSLGAYPWTTYWLNERKFLDIAFRYSITKNFIIKIQGNNLTNQGVSQAYLTPYPMNRYEMNRNRTYSVDFVYKF